MFTNEVRLSGRAADDAQKVGAGPWRFTLAQLGGKKKGGEGRWPTDYFRITCWHASSPGARDVRKGAEVEVRGRLKPVSWTKDGVTHHGFEIIAETVTFAEDPTMITAADVEGYQL
jgi:single-stranded DNA-binding protein